MRNKMTIIIIRKGINGFRYSICNEQGNWIGETEKISEISACYAWGIKHGFIKLVRELKLYPKNKDVIEDVIAKDN